MNTVLKTDDLRREFGRLVAVDGVSLEINDGEITSIIGPNGAGKTTFYNLLTGRLDPTSGTVQLQTRDDESLVDITDDSPNRIANLGLSRGFQINNVFEGLTVLQNIRIARISRDDRTLDFTAVTTDDAELADGAWDIIELMQLEDVAKTDCANLSHGDKRKVEIGLALGTDPSVVLLDEPTAGMNANETDRMVELIGRLDRETDTTFVLTEHDMEVVIGISDRILVLDSGNLIADGAPEAVLSDERVREAYLGLDEDEELDADIGGSNATPPETDDGGETA
ncbi:MAG: ABC-type branched-chain amino acid transport system, ATPase component [uncultured archaeon A07HR60]|nr:MAG: ABC-type branched-chain amino acid transport system, ATPase component [Halorubrum sp. J07HR59]ESS11175.1 MAG: ABC-type branched-chain amino acid transport system, ATPase component [uncultured archaeon A07HR60]